MSTTHLPQIMSLGRNLKEKCTKTAEITYQSLIEVVETLSTTLDISYYRKERKDRDLKENSKKLGLFRDSQKN